MLLYDVCSACDDRILEDISRLRILFPNVGKVPLHSYSISERCYY